jgi:hypothetical protein
MIYGPLPSTVRGHPARPAITVGTGGLEHQVPRASRRLCGPSAQALPRSSRCPRSMRRRGTLHSSGPLPPPLPAIPLADVPTLMEKARWTAQAIVSRRRSAAAARRRQASNASPGCVPLRTSAMCVIPSCSSREGTGTCGPASAHGLCAASVSPCCITCRNEDVSAHTCHIRGETYSL